MGFERDRQRWYQSMEGLEGHHPAWATEPAESCRFRYLWETSSTWLMHSILSERGAGEASYVGNWHLEARAHSAACAAE